jgi:hypothetical protein
MRNVWKAAALVALCAAPAYGQTDLTERQRIADLNQLASFYAKFYAPYEWKRDVIGFDLLRLNPWMQEIHRQTDLDFRETLIEYVASLNDAHDFVSFPSSFTASLPLSVDIYDGKILVDSIDRTLLPAAQYPFAIGDELVAFDGRPIHGVIASLRKYSALGNPLTADRFAAAQLTFRPQQYFPHAIDLPSSASLAIRSAATGTTRTYVVPWNTVGFPISTDGAVPSPGRRLFHQNDAGPALTTQRREGRPGPALIHAGPPPADDTLPPYMTSLMPYLSGTISAERFAGLTLGSKFPQYAPPPGFVLRRGGASSDFFLTGTFVANGRTIGLIRIPNFQPPSASIALQQLDAEIAYFNANTDGLIVDDTRNPGGNVIFAESVLQRLIPTPFRTMGYEIRATQFWLAAIGNAVTSAQQANAPPQIVQNLQAIYDEIQRAYDQNRGRTIPVSLNATGSLTVDPAPNAYSKPLLLLTDEYSASAAEVFAAVIQDNGRGPLFGMRTMGAGGTVVSYNATAYTDSTFYVTTSLMNRGRIVTTPDYPPTPYVENVGVRPDIVQDYMTRANLMTGGSAYVQAFTNAIAALVQAH